MNSEAIHCPLHGKTIDHQTQYSITISIGEPAQNFDVIVDTGSSDFWVQGIECETCNDGPHFNASLSTTFHPGCLRGLCDYTISYGSGVSSAKVGQDRVTMGTFPLGDEVQFGVVYEEDRSITEVLQNSGIMGLGFKSMAAFTFPSIQEYMETFALALDASNSMLSINEVLPAYNSPSIPWANIPVEELEGLYSYWLVGLPTATFGSLQLCGTTTSRCQAVIDSGTGFIAVPSSTWPKIINFMRDAGCYSIGEAGPFACSSLRDLPTLTLTLGTMQGYECSLFPRMYTYQDNGGMYVVGLIESPLEIWILGSLFMQQYYIVFDMHGKQVRMTELLSAVNSMAELVPVPISLHDQPNIFNRFYDEDVAEHVLVVVVLSVSVVLLYLIVYQNGPRRYHWDRSTTADGNDMSRHDLTVVD